MKDVQTSYPSWLHDLKILKLDDHPLGHSSSSFAYVIGIAFPHNVACFFVAERGLKFKLFA